MVWYSTKATEDGDGTVDSDEQLTADEWNQHVTDGHFPGDELNLGVNADGDPVYTDPQNGDQEVLRYDRSAGAWVPVGIDMDGADITNAGSVSTDRSYTTARSTKYLVHTDGSTIYCDGPNGSVASGDWQTVMSALETVVSDRDAIVFNSGDYSVNYQPTFTVPVNLIGNGARLTVADSANVYAFSSDVPNDSGRSYARRNVRICGFDLDGNKANNSTSGLYKQKGELVGVSIYANFCRDFAAPALNKNGITGHVWMVFSNKFVGPGDNAVRLAGTGFNWVVGPQDLGGGITTDTTGENWIINNSIFDAPNNGVKASQRDFICNNLVIDNQKRGIQLVDVDRVLVKNNRIMNNSLESDGTYSGIQLLGNNSSVSNCVLEGNICYNRDPSLNGSGEGLQSHGINLDGAVEYTRIEGGNLRENENGEIKKSSGYSPTDVRITDVTGYRTYNGSTETQSGDGSTTQFSWEHFLADLPDSVSVEAMRTDATGAYEVSFNSSTITVTYSSAPPSGTDNLKWTWTADGRFS